MLVPGQALSLTIEKPAAGGRMIARAAGQIVFVTGAIPGERVTARIERVGKDVAYAETIEVNEASPDRRTPSTDPACGGCLYAHVAYARQLDIKAQVIADAFARIGRIVPPGPVVVASSPDEGYRMRARLHIRGRRVGFFREGTHELCDARPTRQLLPATNDVLDGLAASLQTAAADVTGELELSENVDASHRVVHFQTTTPIPESLVDALAARGGLTGITAGTAGAHVLHGSPYVTDTLTLAGAAPVPLRRHVLAFFQGNRYRLRDLVAHVVAQVPERAELVDLYAGTGLFSVTAAVGRGARVTAIEGDRVAAADLDANAEMPGAGVVAVHQPVERFVETTRWRADAVIVDPPRTGMSRAALEGVLRRRIGRIIYVSCDVATLARDARRLLDAGYAIGRLDAFDLFPNTPHVETVVVFAVA